MTDQERRAERFRMALDAVLFIALGWGVGVWLPTLAAIAARATS